MMFNNLFFVLKSNFLEYGYNFVMLCDLFVLFKCNVIYKYYCFLYLNIDNVY